MNEDIFIRRDGLSDDQYADKIERVRNWFVSRGIRAEWFPGNPGTLKVGIPDPKTATSWHEFGGVYEICLVGEVFTSYPIQRFKRTTVKWRSPRKMPFDRRDPAFVSAVLESYHSGDAESVELSYGWKDEEADGAWATTADLLVRTRTWYVVPEHVLKGRSNS